MRHIENGKALPFMMDLCQRISYERYINIYYKTDDDYDDNNKN